MKIAIISPFAPKKGGLSVYSERTCYELEQIGADVCRIRANNFMDILRLSKALDIYKPDIVRLEFNIPTYGPSVFVLLLMLFLWKKLTSKILIVNYHEVKRETDLLGEIGVITYRVLSKMFDKIFVHTIEAKEILSNRCRIDPKKISIVPLGFVDIHKHNSQSSQLPNRLIFNKKRVVLFFGFIHVDKGLEVLVEAYAKFISSLSRNKNDYYLVIAGEVRTRKGIFRLFEKKDVKYQRKIVNLISSKKIDKQTKFVGYIDDKYLSSFIKQAMVVVLPYSNVEQSGVLNLMIPIGVPVIATNIGGLGELLSGTDLLVEPGDSEGIAKKINLIANNKYFNDYITRTYKKLVKKNDSRRVTKLFYDDICNNFF